LNLDGDYTLHDKIADGSFQFKKDGADLYLFRISNPQRTWYIADGTLKDAFAGIQVNMFARSYLKAGAQSGGGSPFVVLVSDDMFPPPEITYAVSSADVVGLSVPLLYCHLAPLTPNIAL
jgi:hypothetical protein